MKRLLLLLLSASILSAVSSSQVQLTCKKKQSGYSDYTCGNSQIIITERNVSIDLQTTDFTISTLRISDTKVLFMPVKLNETFKSLKSLKIVNSSLTEVKRFDFEGLEGIDELDLRSNQLTTLQSDTFELLYNLNYLILDDNGIKSLPSTIFSKNVKLTEISLRSNKLLMFHDQTFVNLVRLELLYLSDNIIEDLRAGTFDNCKELHKIDISNNNLKYVPYKIFKYNTKLKYYPKHFKHNYCISKADSEVPIKNFEELAEVFKEHCKPPNQDYIEELIKENKDLNEQLQKLTEELNNTLIQLSECKIEEENCRTRLRKKDNEIEVIKLQKESKEEELKNKTKIASTEKLILEQEVIDLKTKVKNLEQSELNLTVDSKDSQRNFMECTRELKIQKETFRALQGRFYDCQVNVTDTMLKLNQETEILKGIKMEKRELEGDIEDLKRKLNATSTMHDELSQLKLYNTFIFQKYKEANVTIAELAMGKCDLYYRNQCELVEAQTPLDQQATLSQPAVPFDYYTMSCTYDYFKYKIATNQHVDYYNCYVNNLKNLNCGSKLKDIKNPPTGSLVTGISFTDTFLTEFPVETTIKFQKLKFMEITRSGFGFFNADICSYSSDFDIIIVTSSAIGRSVKLDKCRSLRDLKIENSEISDISAANSIPSLLNLILKKNRIKSVDREFFSKFVNLRNVQLAGNKLTELKGDIFDKNKELEVVNLADNPIMVVDGVLFQTNPKLAHADVKKLICINKIVLTLSNIKNLGIEMSHVCQKK